MMVLVLGGSGSGKSGYAENYLFRLSKGCKKYYLATMQVFDEEDLEKIRRHQKQREGKGFITIEQPVCIEEALAKMELLEQGQEKIPRTVLLECISNLTANEMFTGEGEKDSRAVAGKIISGLQRLYEGIEHLVIVSNNVFEDGNVYEETTMEYIRALGRMNRQLADMADIVIEVVVGIPVVIKKRRKRK